MSTIYKKQFTGSIDELADHRLKSLRTKFYDQVREPIEKLRWQLPYNNFGLAPDKVSNSTDKRQILLEANRQLAESISGADWSITTKPADRQKELEDKILAFKKGDINFKELEDFVADRFDKAINKKNRSFDTAFKKASQALSDDEDVIRMALAIDECIDQAFRFKDIDYKLNFTNYFSNWLGVKANEESESKAEKKSLWQRFFS